MHGDKKIGLALGILLIGIVGAFFFRNDADQQINAPKMKDPRAIDDLIAQRSLAPYLARRREMAHRPGESVRSRYVQDSGSHELSESRRPNANSRNHESLGPGDPIPLRNHNDRDWPDTETLVQPVVPQPIDPIDAPEPQLHGGEYTIQPNDTLSQLAERFLGSSSRYRDLYELNRDRLKSPDDLRSGKSIRIPQRITVDRTIDNRPVQVSGVPPQTVSQRPLGRPVHRTVFAEPEQLPEQPPVQKEPSPPRRRRKLVLQSIGTPSDD